jgi:hypothetical protein
MMPCGAPACSITHRQVANLAAARQRGKEGGRREGVRAGSCKPPHSLKLERLHIHVSNRKSVVIVNLAVAEVAEGSHAPAVCVWKAAKFFRKCGSSSSCLLHIMNAADRGKCTERQEGSSAFLHNQIIRTVLQLNRRPLLNGQPIWLFFFFFFLAVSPPVWHVPVAVGNTSAAPHRQKKSPRVLRPLQTSAIKNQQL